MDNGSDEDMDFRIKDNFLLFSGLNYFMPNGAKGHHWVLNGNGHGYFNGYGITWMEQQRAGSTQAAEGREYIKQQRAGSTLISRRPGAH